MVADGAEIRRVGADLICSVVATRPDARITAATGRTPQGIYEELGDRANERSIDASAITAVQLDEYVGLPPGDPRSLLDWMVRCFVEPLRVPADRVLRLPTEDLDRTGPDFDETLAELGGLDLAILGLGRNGHLGFNEPPSAADAGTRRVELAEGTIADNATYWGGRIADVPLAAVTLGMRHLLSARHVLLVVSGHAKRDILHRAMRGPIEPSVPGSLLRRAEGEVTVLADRAAWGP